MLERTDVGNEEFESNRSKWERWNEDARLVAEEAEELVVAQRAFLDVDDALLEWDAYIHSLPIEEAQAALDGLKEYAEDVLREREIEQGWHRGLNDS